MPSALTLQFRLFHVVERWAFLCHCYCVDVYEAGKKDDLF